MLSAFLVRGFALYQRGAQWQLVRRQTHRFGCIGQRHAFHLKQNLSRTYHCDPMIGSAFALTHTGFGRLLGDWLVGKHANPNLAAALHEASHGHTAGLDLPVGNPYRLQHFEAEIPERQRTAAPGLARHATALLLAVLHLLWHQHKSALYLCPRTFAILSETPRNPPREVSLERSHARRLLALFRRQNFALVHPALHADHAVRGPGFGKSVFDIGSQRVQRQTPLQIPLRARDFVSVQASAHANFNSLAPEAQRRIYRLAHRAAKAHALFQLQRNRLRNQLGIELGLVHFLDVDEHLAR